MSADMMMLSRVADNLYWFGRYIQRAENTARIVGVHAHVMLDLPRRVAVAWQPLLDISGSNDQFAELFGDNDLNEASVNRFMLLDGRNPVSVLSSLRAARTILRGAREILPRESWELLNELYQSVQQADDAAISRRNRDAFLKRVIDQCLLIWGVISANMPHDRPYQFVRVGASLEQADMTTRMIDVSAIGLLRQPAGDETLPPYTNIQWRSVLMSLTAYQAYRRTVRQRVTGPQVVEFLLCSRTFPRAVGHNLARAARILSQLPGGEPVASDVNAVLDKLDAATLPVGDGLSAFLDQLQGGLGGLNGQINQTFFQPVEVASNDDDGPADSGGQSQHQA